MNIVHDDEGVSKSCLVTSFYQPISSLHCLHQSHPSENCTLGSSFFAFPRSLDIIFVYLTMYLIDAILSRRFLPNPVTAVSHTSVPNDDLLGYGERYAEGVASLL